MTSVRSPAVNATVVKPRYRKRPHVARRTPMGVATFDDEEEEAKKRMETLLLVRTLAKWVTYSVVRTKNEM